MSGDRIVGTSMFLSAHLLAVVLLAPSPSLPVKHFRLIEKSDLPKTFLRYLCGSVQDTSERKDCIKSFEKNGAVWAGDVNDDNEDEYIVDSGGLPGTLGPARSLVQLRGSDWVELVCRKEEDFCDSEWNTLRARFDILPLVRKGYHDLRIEVGHCLKWDGQHYVDYEPADYSQLRAEWFDTKDNHEAELFWMMRYHERKGIRFEPQWFTVSPKEFGRPVQAYIGFPVRVVEFPKLPYVSRQDPELGLIWLSFFKGGVWGVKGNRAFLLVPQPSYLGAQRLELRGDWLFIYGELEEPDNSPDVRYNRRTHELRYTEN
jgi:hypothetical protein